MTIRTLTIAALAIAASSLSACADVTSPTRAPTIAAPANTVNAVSDPTCRSGGWNSSTGRCQ